VIETVAVGPAKQGLGMKVMVSDGPTRLAVDGARAMARLKLARRLAGVRYDNYLKESVFRFDEAVTRPWPVAEAEFLQLVRPAGLELRYDEAAARALQAKLSVVKARYSRWLPQENEETGEITGWVFEPGDIDAAAKADVAEGLEFLGWRQHLFPFAFEDACEVGTKQDVLLATHMGYGKTRAAMALAEYWKWREKRSAPTIIVAQRKHLQTWEEELGGLEGVQGCELLIAMYGAGCYERWLEASDRPAFNQPFLLISFERLWRLSAEDFERLQAVARDSTIIVDEAYSLQNKSAKRTKAMFRLWGAHHVSITGTPIQSYVDQLLALLQWTFRGGSIALPDYPVGREGSELAWARKYVTYAISEDGSRKKVPFIRNVEDLWELLAPLMKRRLRNEPEIERVLGVAKVIPERVPVELNADHMRNYRAVLQQFTEWYLRELAARGTPNAFPANELLVKLGYLVWNVSAPWRMQDHSDEEFKFPAYPRQLTSVHERAVEVTLAELEEGNRVIVAGRSSEALDLIGETLIARGIPTAVVHGKVSVERRKEIFRRCRTGEYRVLCGSIGTIAEGLNLNFANRVVVTEYPWNPAQIHQLLARITRGVQTSVPKAYLLYAQGTIQEYMLALCDLKDVSISAALDRRSQDEDSEIPDIQAYCASLVGVEGEEQVQARLFELEEV